MKSAATMQNFGEPMILVADDDQSTLSNLSSFLLREGFPTIPARDGVEALTILVEEPDIGLVLLDRDMPGLDGMGVLREMSMQQKAPPVLMMLEETDRDFIPEAIRAGAIDCLLKPIANETLLFKLNTLLVRQVERTRRNAAQRKAVRYRASSVAIIVDTSDTGLTFNNTYFIPVGSVLPMMCDALDLPHGQRLMVKVEQCRGRGNRYEIKASFVNRPSLALQEKLREIRGNK